jgi:hypothetical protein
MRLDPSGLASELMMMADLCNEIIKAKNWLPLMTLILELAELQNGIPYRDRELFVTPVIVVLIGQKAVYPRHFCSMVQIHCRLET